MAAARYWRILIIQYSENVASISRVEFRTSVGGANVIPGSPTVISSGSWTTVNNLFDGVDSTFGYCAPTRSVPCSAGIDFGASSGSWPDVVEFAVRNRSPGSGAEANQGPVNMVLQSSPDNATWTNVAFVTDADWGASFSQVRVYTVANYLPGRKVLDIVTPPTDAGPSAITLTAGGNATVSGGRFIFDGNGDSYSNTAVPASIYRIPYHFSLEVDAILAPNDGFNGIVNIGNTANRFLLTTQDGNVQIWENAEGVARLTAAAPQIDGTTPANLLVHVEGSTLRLYVNGVLAASGTCSAAILQSANDLYLGIDPILNSRSLLGSFAGVRITHGLVPAIAAGGRRRWMVNAG
jgi:hypothetical protein